MYDVRAAAAPKAPWRWAPCGRGRTSRLWASAHATLLSSAVTMTIMIYSV